MWLFCACPICPKCPIVQSLLPRIARKRDFKSFGLNRNSISHFKAPLSAFLGSGVMYPPKGRKSILGHFRGISEGVLVEG